MYCKITSILKIFLFLLLCLLIIHINTFEKFIPWNKYGSAIFYLNSNKNLTNNTRYEYDYLKKPGFINDKYPVSPITFNKLFISKKNKKK